jgi:hypothetical protein
VPAAIASNFASSACCQRALTSRSLAWAFGRRPRWPAGPPPRSPMASPTPTAHGLESPVALEVGVAADDLAVSNRKGPPGIDLELGPARLAPPSDAQVGDDVVARVGQLNGFIAELLELGQELPGIALDGFYPPIDARLRERGILMPLDVWVEVAADRVEPATFERFGYAPDDLHVLSRHRPPSIARKAGAGQGVPDPSRTTAPNARAPPAPRETAISNSSTKSSTRALNVPARPVQATCGRSALWFGRWGWLGHDPGCLSTTTSTSGCGPTNPTGAFAQYNPSLRC